MSSLPFPAGEPEVAALLRDHGITPTSQRMLIVRSLFEQQRHMAADDLYRLINASTPQVSKATVYNTLRILAEKGVIRTVIADPERLLYDPNTTPHHHLYDEVTGELTDIDAKKIQVTGVPPLPAGSQLQGIDVVIRIRRTSNKK
jgi:Fur family iron response transcriptional regulator